MSHPQLRLGSTGPEVTNAKRLVNRELGLHANTTPIFGPWFRRLVKRVQAKHGIPQTGVIGPKTWAVLDPPPALPPLVKPNQGFESLVEDLWRPYTDGRNAGLTDLGTYNPASKLPSGRPSDHATSRLDGRIGEPACAFDLGFTPATRPAALAFFSAMMINPACEYVIMEDRIFSRSQGLHRYTAGGHSTHVHVSGRRR